MLLAIVWIALCLLLLVVGGEILLRGAVSLATLLRLTPAVIGLTVVAAGTCVPELLPFLYWQRKITRPAGVVLLLAYAAYMTARFLRT